MHGKHGTAYLIKYLVSGFGPNVRLEIKSGHSLTSLNSIGEGGQAWYFPKAMQTR